MFFKLFFFFISMISSVLFPLLSLFIVLHNLFECALQCLFAFGIATRWESTFVCPFGGLNLFSDGLWLFQGGSDESITLSPSGRPRKQFLIAVVFFSFQVRHFHLKYGTHFGTCGEEKPEKPMLQVIHYYVTRAILKNTKRDCFSRPGKSRKSSSFSYFSFFFFKSKTFPGDKKNPVGVPGFIPDRYIIFPSGLLIIFNPWNLSSFLLMLLNVRQFVRELH